MSGPDRAGVLVSLPMAFVMDSQVGLRQSDVIVFVLKIILVSCACFTITGNGLHAAEFPVILNQAHDKWYGIVC